MKPLMESPEEPYYTAQTSFNSFKHICHLHLQSKHVSHLNYFKSIAMLAPHEKEHLTIMN